MGYKCKKRKKEYAREHYKKHREKYLERSLRAREENPLQISRAKRNCWYKKKYNITLEQVELLYEKQRGLCLICKKEMHFNAVGGKHVDKACVDHCHHTGVVRGLLCDACNRGLGCFKDNSSILKKAVEYIQNATDITKEVTT